MYEKASKEIIHENSKLLKQSQRQSSKNLWKTYFSR